MIIKIWLICSRQWLLEQERGCVIHCSMASMAIINAALGGLSLLLLMTFIGKLNSFLKRRHSQLPPVPGVPRRIPLFGNLLQINFTKPHMTFTNWAEQHGAIYSVQMGASNVVVLNTADVAKEAMVTKFNSISSRKLSRALIVLSSDKCMVAMSDYDAFHRLAKKHIITNVLGTNAQKQHRCHREAMMDNMLGQLHEHMKSSPNELVNFRVIFAPGLSLKLAVGEVVSAIHVEVLNKTLTKEDMYKILVLDFIEGAIEVDWRDYFPYLKWIPNKRLEETICAIAFHRKVVIRALIDKQKKRIASGKEVNCYIDYLLSVSAETKELTEDQILMLETSDTTLVASEWAMYELAKDKSRQERLYQELQNIYGSQRDFWTKPVIWLICSRQWRLEQERGCVLMPFKLH